MKNGFQYWRVLAGLALLLSSCYKDKGNYDYHEINEIVITKSEYSYTTPKEGKFTDFEIKPTITQTMTSGTENLAYEWRRQVGTFDWQVVGTEPTYTLTVSSDDTQPIQLRLAVTDTNLGITTYEEITVKPIFQFNQSWFLLQNIDGQAVLGCIDGEGNGRVVTKDIYSQEMDTPLEGAPVGLGMNNFLKITEPQNPNAAFDVILGVFTSNKPYILNGSSLEDYRLNYQRLLYEKKVTGDATFDPQIMKGNRDNFVVVDNGKFWYGYPDNLALMYPIQLSDDLGGGYNYTITGVGMAKKNRCVVYDDQGKRFLNFIGNAYERGLNNRIKVVNGGGDYDQSIYMDEGDINRQDRITAITDMSTNRFDPQTDIPGDFKLDYMGCSASLDLTGETTYDITTLMAIGHSGQNFKIYEFYPDGSEDTNVGICSNMWTVASQGNPTSMSEDGKWPVTTSSAFKQMFFYAAGNAIYRVDLTQQTPDVKVIYETDPSKGKIKFLKLKSDNEDIAYIGSGEGYSHKGITRHLGILQEDEQGNDTLVELQLTAAGEIALDENKEQIIYTFEGAFKHVVDMLFVFREII